MSRFAFISDIHGNYPAFEAVLNDIDKKNVDFIYCLGDLVGYYSQINEVIDAIRTRNIKCILGNHDYAMVYEKGVIKRSKTCTDVLTRQIGYISESNYSFLSSLGESLVIEDEGNKILAVHGGLNNHIDEYINEIDDLYFTGIDSSITHVISAHNHISVIKSLNNVQYANSGSVGQPRDHNPYASYLIYDNGLYEVIRVRYDYEQTIRKMQEDGFPLYIAEVLRGGYRIGEKWN